MKRLLLVPIVFALVLASAVAMAGVRNPSSPVRQSKRANGCATAGVLNATCTTDVTWAVAFPDANYTVVCQGGLITSGLPMLFGLSAKTSTKVTVQTLAVSIVAAQFTTVECHATHD